MGSKMELDEFKRLNLDFDEIIEYTLDKSRETRLAYFVRLIENPPGPYKTGGPSIPFITIGHSINKDRCVRNWKDIALEDILYLWKKGKSSLFNQ